MALEFIGFFKNKRVFVTPYAKWRLASRNLSHVEALEVLSKRDVSYPPDENGRQKVRSTLNSNKRTFLVILEDREKIIIITGGES